MNYYLSHTELENIRYIIGEHRKIALQLEDLSQISDNPKTRTKLQADAEIAKLAQQQLLSFFN